MHLIDAFDTWALRKIARIPYTRQMSNVEVRRTTGCSPLSHLVTNRRLRLFGDIEPLQRVSDKYRPTGSDQQEDLATLGSVQLRQTLALWTLASRLPGERPLLETNGDILWTQQRSSGVRSERKTLTQLQLTELPEVRVWVNYFLCPRWNGDKQRRQHGLHRRSSTTDLLLSTCNPQFRLTQKAVIRLQQKIFSLQICNHYRPLYHNNNFSTVCVSQWRNNTVYSYAGSPLTWVNHPL